MLRRQISAIFVIIFVVVILINFIFSYSVFTFYKDAKEGMIKEEEKSDKLKTEIETEKEETEEYHLERSTTRLPFSTDKNANAPKHDEAKIPETTDDPNMAEQLIEEFKLEKRFPGNASTTFEPKPEYYNSDEYYGDSNENLEDRNYNNYDDAKFIVVVTPPGVQSEKKENKLD